MSSLSTSDELTLSTSSEFPLLRQSTPFGPIVDPRVLLEIRTIAGYRGHRFLVDTGARTFKEAGALQTPAGEYIQKIDGGVYANAQQSWDDDFLEFVSPNPFVNTGFTALNFAGLPGQPVNNTWTGN